MLKTIGSGLLVMALAGLCTVVLAQEKEPAAKSKSTPAKSTPAKSTAAKSTAKSESSESAKEGTGRLPRFFAGLVDDAQREKIYAIQASYQDKIEALEKELAKLKEAELSEMEKVLTAAQRKELETLRSDSEKPLAEKSDADSASDPDSTKAKAASTKKKAKAEPAEKE